MVCALKRTLYVYIDYFVCRAGAKNALDFFFLPRRCSKTISIILFWRCLQLLVCTQKLTHIQSFVRLEIVLKFTGEDKANEKR